MKYGILLFAISSVIFCNAIFSQDAAALKILESTADKAISQKDIKIAFEYVVTTTQDESEDVYSGEFIVKGKKYKMTIDETITFCNGKTRWVYLVESNEVNVSEVINDEDMEIEDQFLNDPLSIYKIYEKGFKYSLAGTGDFNGQQVNQIDLSPNDINKPYFKIRYLINSDSELKAIKYFQKDGTRVLLTIKSFNSGNKFKDHDFVFEASQYPDVEIIDLR